MAYSKSRIGLFWVYFGGSDTSFVYQENGEKSCSCPYQKGLLRWAAGWRPRSCLRNLECGVSCVSLGVCSCL